MARLPTAEQLGQRPTPQARGGISRLDLKAPRQGQQAAALDDFGKAIKGLGGTLAQLAIKEKMELDEARIEEATSMYQNGLLKFELDEKEGFVNILTGEAVKRPLAEEYKTKREDLVKEIEKTLGDDTQRTAFGNRVNVANRQFDARLFRHVAEQSRAYQSTVSAGVVATERRLAALNWSQPGQIEMSILRTGMEVERKARLDGLNPDDEGDRQVIDTLKIINETQIHSDVVDQMILQGKDIAAAQYYEGVKSRLTPEALTVMGTKVRSSAVEGQAIRGADTAWQAMGPQNLNDPVRLDLMENFIRDRYKDDPKAMKAAVQDLRSRATAHRDGQQEYNASNKAKIIDAFQNGADLKKLQAMPEYWAIGDEERTKLRDYIVDAGWTQQQRARSEASYREGEKASAGFQKYWELSNPQVLSIMSEAQIMALVPELGMANTQGLLKMKRSMNTPDKVRAATIDSELFNVLAADAGLDPYTRQMSPGDKEYLGRLRNQVETSIDTAQQQLGRSLTRKEKEEVMRAEVDKKVLVDKWGKDPKIPAAVVRPDQRQNIYVPLKEIDPGWAAQALNYMRSTGSIPVNLTDEEAKKQYRGRLERAYAISITGGTSEEGRKALEGDQ